MAKYRAVRSSYGFRGQFWEMGDVADSVTKSEAERVDVKAHFALIKDGESDEVAPHKSFEEREVDTLSDIQDRTQKAERKTRIGL